MLFNSIEFAVFFPIVTLLFFLLPHRWRALHLLVASCLFYMAFVPQYILILGATILVDYYAGILIEDSSNPARKKTALIVSIISTCGILFFFKYFNFFNESAQLLANAFGMPYAVSMIKIMLPIGLSFHTFQSLSYVIEVYRGHQKAERDFIIYSLYVMFYPQLVAGPIERPQNLLYQFHQRMDFQMDRVVLGLKLMAWGLFKKVVIADRLSPLVDHIYGNPQGHDGLALVIATVFFAIQIYCDFSGYSDMAIGAAQVMGFRLMSNFDRPYSAQSLGEFWRRWHISLSTWFKDYVYIPLGGSRGGLQRTAINLLITFLLSGLWHGANWTFVIWGGVNGLLLVGEAIIARFAINPFSSFENNWWVSNLRVLRTFVLICCTWVFFRARSVGDAIYILRHSVDGFGSMVRLGFGQLLEPSPTQLVAALDLGVTETSFALSLLLIVFLFIAERKPAAESSQWMPFMQPWWKRWPVYLGLVYGILFLGVFQKSQFIYFQF